jgi:hypothetical protein
LGRVHVIHLNDSRGALTSHRDHHARLGEGTIPLEGLAAFLRTPQLAHTTTILETPLTMIGEAPDGAASAASDQSDAEDEATARPAQVDWDAERRRLFQACELAGTA